MEIMPQTPSNDDRRFVVLQGEKIKILRSNLGWDQQVLAEKANVDEKSIQNTERGRRVQLGTARLIADALKVEVTEIIARQDLAPVPGSLGGQATAEPKIALICEPRNAGLLPGWLSIVLESLRFKRPKG